ncbi:DUF115 domain-containing protein, partial [Candidatus Thorarchaeota archaeon]
DPRADRKATNRLTEILSEIDPFPLLQRLDTVVRGRTVVICGAGPSLEKHIESLSREKSMMRATYLVADGAVSLLLNKSWPCHVLVTDLDGNSEDIQASADSGALLIVHGHGDNLNEVERTVPGLGQILGSTQVEPTERAFLWGGFTDGDRACHIAVEHGADEIVLAGMDFGKLVGKWSKPEHDEHFVATDKKRAKLEIAEILLERLFSQSTVKYRFLR